MQSFSDRQLFFGSEGIVVIVKTTEMLGAGILKVYLEYISQHFDYLVLCACFQQDCFCKRGAENRMELLFKVVDSAFLKTSICCLLFALQFLKVYFTHFPCCLGIG